MSSQSLIQKDPQPDAKYFSSYKSNEVDKTSFNYCTTLTSLLLCWDRLGRAMANAFAGNANSIAWDLVKENGEKDPCKKNPLEGIETCWEKDCLRKDTIFIFIFWGCGLAFLFFGLWVFYGSGSFFLKGTVGCSNFWIGQFDKKKLSGWAELMCKPACTLAPEENEEQLSGPLFVAELMKSCACAQAFRPNRACLYG